MPVIQGLPGRHLCVPDPSCNQIWKPNFIVPIPALELTQFGQKMQLLYQDYFFQFEVVPTNQNLVIFFLKGGRTHLFIETYQL